MSPGSGETPHSLSSCGRSLWQEVRHPFFWFQEQDLPRLRYNAELPFWKSKFEAWRRELEQFDHLPIVTPTIDFHLGTNTNALKAAMCFVVDGDEHFGRLVADFLSSVIAHCRTRPDWRVRMGTNGPGEWTGNQWGGLAENHIIDPQVWLSCGHLYDVIYGKNFLSEADSQAFEDMMALCHQVSCLHEEMHKLDNNRSIWLTAGGYLSTLFDRNPIRAGAARERLRGNMYRFLETILEDGIHYEIGPYGPGSIAAMQVFARCIRGAEGMDFFSQKVDGVGFEEAYRSMAASFIPGSSLRMPCVRDRVNHWESLCAGYLEYNSPDLAWVVSRMADRAWVPMFRHWPQGFEFYTYKEPTNARKPTRFHSHFQSSGISILRSSWNADASSLYFRYGFQGSSHGGGLDKLNIELTCNDEPLIADPMLTERSHDKNVVIIDGHNQEQCTGKLLYSDLREEAPVQVVSALGGFGSWPKRKFLQDPRAEINYWSTKSEECFPGVARMRRTVVLVQKCVYVIRDTLWALDGKEHEYQWLFHTFCDVATGNYRRRAKVQYFPKRRHYSEATPSEYRKVDIHALPPGDLFLASEKASLAMRWSSLGALLPAEIGLSRDASRYAFDGSPETGDGFMEKMLNRLHLNLSGKSVALTTVLMPTPTGRKPRAHVEDIREVSMDCGEIFLHIDGRRSRIDFDEAKQTWNYCLASPE